MLYRYGLCCATLALALFVLDPAESAAQTTWTKDASASWNDPANWSSGVPNAAGAIANFGNVITADRTVTINNAVTLGVLNLDGAAFRYTIGGSSLTLDNNGAGAQINVTSATTWFQTIGTVLNLAEAATITNNIGASRNLRFDGTLNFNSNTLTVDGAGETDFASNLLYSNPGTVIKNGSGLLLIL